MFLIKNTYYILQLLIFSIAITSCSSDSPTKSDEDAETEPSNRVLLIGVDGLLPDGLKASDTPHMDELISTGIVTYDAFTGGDLGTETQQVTSSGPGWSTIFTGVWVDKHNVVDNSFSNANYDEYPCFFTRIKEVLPDAYLSSIVNWEPINQYIVENADHEDNGSDPFVAIKAIAHLQNHDPDVLFLHFDNVDYAGHGFGYSPDSPEYIEAIEGVDNYIGSVISGIKSRPAYDNEDWLIIITTDHGGIGTGHGGQSDLERFVPIIVSGKNTSQRDISPGPGLVAIPATVCTHLGIEIDQAWGWESDAVGLADPGE